MIDEIIQKERGRGREGRGYGREILEGLNQSIEIKIETGIS